MSVNSMGPEGRAGAATFVLGATGSGETAVDSEVAAFTCGALTGADDEDAAGEGAFLHPVKSKMLAIRHRSQQCARPKFLLKKSAATTRQPPSSKSRGANPTKS